MILLILVAAPVRRGALPVFEFDGFEEDEVEAAAAAAALAFASSKIAS